MKILLSYFLLLLPFNIWGQKTNIDSLLRVCETMKDDTLKVQNYFDIAKAYKLEKIDFDKTTLYAQKSIDLSYKLKYYGGVIKAMLLIGQNYREQTLNKQAIETFLKVVNVFETHQELFSNPYVHGFYINANTLIADIYVSLSDFVNAEKYAFKALNFAEKHNIQKGKCWMALGNIFSVQNNISEARKYTQKALDNFKELHQESDMARAYSFLAMYYYSEEDYTNTLANYKLAYETYKKVNNVYGIRVSLYNLAQVSVKIEDYVQAKKYLTEVYKYTSAQKDAAFLYHINKLNFNLSLGEKNFEEAKRISKEIMHYAEKQKSHLEIKQAYIHYYNLYLALNDTANAFKAIEKISELKDSIYNNNIAKNTAELAKKYETEKKEQQIDYLAKENKLKESKLLKELLLQQSLEKQNKLQEIEIEQKLTIQQGLERENNLKKIELTKKNELNSVLTVQNGLMVDNAKKSRMIGFLMIIALLILLIFVVNYYKNYKRQQVANKKIAKQGEDLKSLIYELNHRVKNNFQMVVSMLQIQSRGIKDAEVSDILMQTSNRFQAISLVHEKLYQVDAFNNTRLIDYLSDLVKNISTHYSLKSLNYDLKAIDHNQLMVNMENVAPIALIVNELATNSFKHGFVEGNRLEIILQIIKLDASKFKLVFKDNGPGLTQNYNQSNSFGFKLIKLFVEQLNGSLNHKNNNGLEFNIEFEQ